MNIEKNDRFRKRRKLQQRQKEKDQKVNKDDVSENEESWKDLIKEDE